MSDSAVNPYASAGADDVSGTPPPASDDVEDPGARRVNPVGSFFRSLVSKETWKRVGTSTAEAAKKAGHATSKTAKHLTKGSTWSDKEKGVFAKDKWAGQQGVFGKETWKGGLLKGETWKSLGGALNKVGGSFKPPESPRAEGQGQPEAGAEGFVGLSDDTSEFSAPALAATSTASPAPAPAQAGAQKQYDDL